MGIRLWVMIALLLLAGGLVLSAPALAWKASKIGIELGDITFGNEALLQKPTATLFHTETLAATDNEALGISFPAAATGGTGGLSIGQTTDMTAAATETGYFTANWCYVALSEMNDPGGYLVTPDVSAWQPMRSPALLGSGLIWPYMTDAGPGTDTAQIKPAVNTSLATGGISVPLGNASAGNISTGGLSPGNVSTGNTSTGGLSLGNVSSGNLTQSTARATPNRDYKNMTTADIRNDSGLERLYRNANLVNQIPLSYKGTVTHPTVIDPLEKPMDILKTPDMPKIINDAKNMTQPGGMLRTLFWDV